jgi:hypothetical protein
MFQPSLDVPALVFSLPLPLGNGSGLESSLPALAEHDLGLKPYDWSVLRCPLAKANGNEIDSFEFKLQLASYSEKQAKA